MRHRFAGFELDEERYELRRGGTPIVLQPKVMEVLLHLVRNAERTLPRDEILDAVWPDLNVGEASLTRCISQARRALGESEGDAQIIQTVRGRGYRIGVPVEHGEAPGFPNGPATSARPPRWRPIALAGAALLSLLVWLARPLAPLDPLPPVPVSSANPVTSVAVLPFRPIGVGDGGQPLGESVALEVADRLGEIAELRVMSPAASFHLDSRGGDPAAIAAELGAGTLVLGRLRRAGERLRVEVELVDAESGFRRWSRSYEGDPDEIFALQREVAREVARVLGLSVHAGAEFAHQQPDVDATRYLLEGRLAVLSADRERMLEAVELYERAIELDPERASSYVALAAAYEHLWQNDDPGLGWIERAEAVSRRAIELDPQSGEAWTTHATVLSARRDWDGAERAALRAIELGPSALALVELARVRCRRGRPREALAPALRAVELDPLESAAQHTAGRVLYYLGENDRAIAHLRRAMQLAPRAAYVPATLASALQAKGRTREAAEVVLRTLPSWIRPALRIHHRLFGGENGLRLLLAMDAARSGRRCGRDAYETAALRARLGDRGEVLACLARAAAHHLWYVRSEPVFDPYRDDPEFRRILRAAGFGGD